MNQSFLVHSVNGIVPFIRPAVGAIGHQMEGEAGERFTVSLNSSLGYYCLVTDPTYQFISINPGAVTRTLIRFAKDSLDMHIFLKVSLVLTSFDTSFIILHRRLSKLEIKYFCDYF